MEREHLTSYVKKLSQLEIFEFDYISKSVKTAQVLSTSDLDLVSITSFTLRNMIFMAAVEHSTERGNELTFYKWQNNSLAMIQKVGKIGFEDSFYLNKASENYHNSKLMSVPFYK